MADTKVSAFTELTGANSAPTDLVPIIDVSDISQGAGGTAKIITRQGFQTYNAGTLTTDVKVLDLSATWNNAAVAFTLIKANATSTASAAGSLLMDLQVGASSQAYVTKDGIIASTKNGAHGVAIIVAGQTPVGFGRNSSVGGLSLHGGGATPSDGNATALIGGSTGVFPLIKMDSGTQFGWATSAVTQNFDTSLARIAAGIVGVRGAATTNGAAVSMIEQTAPSAPAANGVYIYAQDNGAGKTQLMAIFATGAAQQIAIEP